MADVKHKRTSLRPSAVWAGIVLATIGCACNAPSVVPDGDYPPHQDAGGDGDADEDTDADGDWRAGFDADVETPLDSVQVEAPVVGACLDGQIQEGEGFIDCTDVMCLDETGCCLETTRDWIEGDFSTCSSLDLCGWTAFPADGHSVVLDEPWVVLTSSSSGEAGVYTDQVVETIGEPVLTFSASLDQAVCTADQCEDVLGVALTRQQSVSSATGISPVTGVVIDGEQGALHLMVGGRIDSSISPAAFETLTTTTGYAISILSDRRVALWYGLDVDTSGDDPVVERPTREPDLVSLQGVGIGGERLRVALFGHFSASGSGRVGGVDLHRPICDVPDGFQRVSNEPVISASDDEPYVGRPSVVRRPGGMGLLMVFEHGPYLAVSTSQDGVEWTEPRHILFELAPTPYGRVARRAPALLFVENGVIGEGYHLWFEGVSEHAGILAGEEPRQAIVHAHSPDGFDWLEEPDGSSIAVKGDADHLWRIEVGQPSVIMSSDGTLLMFYIGTHTGSGLSQLGWARSPDGKTWQLADDPIVLGEQNDLDFDRDGVGYPCATRRGDVVHLWYTGFSGGSASIGYAVGALPGGQISEWSRYGEVLGAERPWEARRVLAPAVVTMPEDVSVGPGTLTVGTLRLWYAAGQSGLERIGEATREIPSWIDEASDEEP